jgi:hypothetical protein
MFLKLISALEGWILLKSIFKEILYSNLYSLFLQIKQLVND